MGSRDGYRQLETGEDEVAALGPMEIEFITERDSLYQGTVGESGWPYVQHRGGPPGFLKVLDDRTLGYADFSGNRQYLSVGNLAGDDRVSLFLMDYAQQRRLKIWGRARLVDESIEPELIARLESPGYRARSSAASSSTSRPTTGTARSTSRRVTRRRRWMSCCNRSAGKRSRPRLQRRSAAAAWH